MIIVNLLPHHLRPIKRTPIPHILSVMVLAGVLVTIGILFVRNVSTLGGINAEILTTQTDLASLQYVLDESDRLTQQKKNLRARTEVIQEILQGRTIWSQELNRLAHLTPENVWYSSISIIRKQRTTYVDETDAKGVVKSVAKRVPYPVLELSGYARNDEDGIPSVEPLIKNTTQDCQFKSKFEMDAPSTDPVEFNGIQVQSFTLQYWINPSDQIEECD
jgi:Tfp pilus assembly protein PilN